MKYNTKPGTEDTPTTFKQIPSCVLTATSTDIREETKLHKPNSP